MILNLQGWDTPTGVILVYVRYILAFLFKRPLPKCPYMVHGKKLCLFLVFPIPYSALTIDRTAVSTILVMTTTGECAICYATVAGIAVFFK